MFYSLFDIENFNVINIIFLNCLISSLHLISSFKILSFIIQSHFIFTNLNKCIMSYEKNCFFFIQTY